MGQEEEGLFYVPVALSRAREQIAQEHKIDLTADDLSRSSWQEVVVKHVAAVEGGRLERFMHKLSERDVCLLAQYLPHNYYKTEIGSEGYAHVAYAVESRSSEKVMSDLLLEWQMEYDRPECNRILLKLAHRDGNLRKALNKTHFGGLFVYLLEQPEIPKSLARIIARDARIPGKDFDEKMTGLGLRGDLKLYQETEKRYMQLQDLAR